ncbi:MAG: MarR family winged helix-turn-helix transcriptional regulator [Alphaproteobacteria bacterium]
MRTRRHNKPHPATSQAAGAGVESPAALVPFDNVLASIHAVSNQVDRAFYNEVEIKHDVSIAEWRIVMTLAERPSATAAQIIELWGVEKMAVSRAVRRLESMGRVRRKVNASDRRSYALVLTPAGRHLYEEMVPGARARYREIVGALSREEIAVLRANLHKLLTHLRQLKP